MPIGKITGGKLKTRWIYKHFAKMKKITSARKSNFLFPFAHAMKFSPDPKNVNNLVN